MAILDHQKQCVVMGASGRIGRLLQHRWGGGAARWQSRAALGDDRNSITLDPLADPDALARAGEGCSVILCLAGPVPGRSCEDMQRHSDLACAAVRCGAAVGARVLLASSAAVYGAAVGGQGGLCEDQPLAPANAYGAAKAEMEQVAAALGAELGVAVTALRIGNIAGFDAILGGWKPGFQLDLFPDGSTPRRSYIALSTLADVLAALVEMQNLPPVLNIAQPGTVEMAAVLRAAGYAFATRPAPDSAIPEVALDVSRLAGLLEAGSIPLPFADPAAMAAEWSMLEPVLNQSAPL